MGLFSRLFGTTEVTTETKPIENKETEMSKFISKQEYLTWRAAWREEYRKITEEIRGYKRDLRGKPHTFESSTKQMQLHVARVEATRMIEQRIQSKKDANASYLAAKHAAYIVAAE